jgi:predicted RNA methylase
MPMPADSSSDRTPAKDLYRELRTRSCAQLWDVEVPRFDRAGARERLDRVAVVRAVGVVFAETGTPAQQDAARAWLRGLLQDPAEKIRRYAVNALPKLGAGAAEEAELLARLGDAANDREQRALGEALAKIGGAATLAQMPAGSVGSLRQAEQKIRARIARDEGASEIDLEGRLGGPDAPRIHLRGRLGLEEIVAGEADEFIQRHGQFRRGGLRPGVVELQPLSPFCLADVFRLRCFDTVGLALGSVNGTHDGEILERLAALLASPRTLRLLRTLTRGPIRYRLDFVGKGHQRAAVHQLAERVFALCPDLLNDPNAAPWTIEIHSLDRGARAELVPALKPDPRLRYRQGDVPAASHPPLAACLAWLAGQGEHEVVWDPFCGSGLELVERALLGGVDRLIGSDLSEEALEVAGRNFAAANPPGAPVQFIAGDFREVARRPELGPGSASLILTNPPMGMRIQLADLRGLLHDLLKVAAYVLQPDGRIVFPNPVRLAAEAIPPALELEYARTVDMGGFKCRLELYRKRSGR